MTINAKKVNIKIVKNLNKLVESLIRFFVFKIHKMILSLKVGGVATIENINNIHFVRW